MSHLPRHLTALMLAGLLAALSACSILPEAEPVNVYQLPAARVSASTQEPLPLLLRLNTPSAGFAQSSPRILVNPEGNQLSTYKGARWSDPAPVLLRNYLQRALQDAALVTDVSHDEQGLHADLHLSGELRRFQVIYPDGPVRAVIDFKARLVDPRNRRTLASQVFVIEQPLADPGVDSVVAGFAQAAQQLTDQLLAWSAEQLDTYSQD